MTILEDAQQPSGIAQRANVRSRESLTARLLALGAGFVMLTEALVFLPSITNFRNDWLKERFDTAELAALAAADQSGQGLGSGSDDQLLVAAQIKAVVAKFETTDQLLLGVKPIGQQEVINLERQTYGGAIFETIETFFAPEDRILVITNRPRSNAAIKLEVYAAEAPLKAALLREAGQVFINSMLLAILIGMLIYAALADGFVRPMRQLTMAITRFRAAPQDATRTLKPSGRNDEIGAAEVAFIEMQETVRQSFLQRERLAQLGLSVSKISHDLRHSLGAAQLVSERLSSVDDPVVRIAAPRLERALERAIGLAQSTLQFGKAQEAPPTYEVLYLVDSLDEAASEALNGIAGVTWENGVAQSVEIEADPDQLHRILTNLIRNAGQAINATKRGGRIAATSRIEGDLVVLEIADTGPGLPRGVRENLFAPFSGSGLSGGTGLGLAIARDLARMNGGDLHLVSTDNTGTCFCVKLRKVN
jgi:signal transduction histidine kinase